MKQRNKPEQNQGFTLLEVLIAVIVLGIVIVPMLHSFVSSHRMNSRSKQYMRATTLAQDEMEIFEKEKLENLTDPTKFPGYTVTPPDPTDPTDNGCYEFKKDDVSNDSAGSSASRFDVTIELDPERASPIGRYFDENTKALFYMDKMGEADSGSYVQTVRNSTNPTGYDESVYALFHTMRATGGDGDSWSADTFAQKIARRIHVKIFQESNGFNWVTKVKVIYEYVLCQDNVMQSGYQRHTEESIVFDNAQKLDDDGNPIDLKSIYLFYAPRYVGYLTPISYLYNVDGTMVNFKTNEDWIIVENEAKLPVDVFILRQDILQDGSISDTEPVPVQYQAKLEIYDGMNADGETCGNYFTNLNLDSPVMTGAGQQTELILHDYGNPSRTFGRSEVMAIANPRAIGASSDGQTLVKDRIYSMTVKVYPHGADQSTTDPIVTMTGSKLE
ncbi:MAG: prepilin-type N-terminal cleavage/methylation domain-containing protein [Muribaculaceae bacterium]|nr:prepilin-type N-terminal cleavage/methylation domain-containing protein [Muribaculaceae bacterium]